MRDAPIYDVRRLLEVVKSAERRREIKTKLPQRFMRQFPYND